MSEWYRVYEPVRGWIPYEGRQTAYMVVIPNTVNTFAVLFIYTPAGRASFLLMAPA